MAQLRKKASPFLGVKKLFTAVIYCRYTVVMSFRVIRQYKCGNYNITVVITAVFE
jgi:hypothetical protein